MEKRPPFKAQTREQLIAILEDMLAGIQTNDSFEGQITYSALEAMEEGDEPGTFRVYAAYRIGNSMGQGGMRIVMEDKDEGA